MTTGGHKAADDLAMTMYEQAWTDYLELERAGGRSAALAKLREVVSGLKATDAEARALWVDRVLREKFEQGAEHPLRQPLFEAIVFPVLVADNEAGKPRAALWLAMLYPTLSTTPACLSTLGHSGPVDLWREAYRRNRGDARARRELVSEMARYIEYTLHELPAGVLFGVDGSTREECVELETLLDEFRRLLQEDGEGDGARARLAGEAAFHYRAYREYLTDRRGHDTYASFVREAGRPHGTVV